MRRNQRKKKKLVITDKKKFIRSLAILVAVVLICFSVILVRNILKSDTPNSSTDALANTSAEEYNVEDKDVKEDSTITLGVIGDIMCHNTQYKDAYDSSSKSYNFSYVFEDVKQYLQTPDVTIGNLETTFAGADRGYSSYPTFNTPEVLATNLKEAGVDVLSTANNHSLDKGYKGIESTIRFLDEADIAHTGTYTSQESQDKILYKSIKGVKFAFLSYTYGTNGIPVPEGKDYCINLIDKDLIKKHLDLAKQEGAEIICVNMHWGQEYQTKPNDEQKELADFLFQNGANIILGSHPHVLQSMEKRTVTLDDGTTRDGFVIYSLGNFMSGQVKENTRDSVILNLQVTRKGDTGAVTIDHAEYVPIYMYKSSSGSKKYKVLDIEKRIENYDSGKDTSIGKSNYQLLKKELEKIKEFVGPEF